MWDNTGVLHLPTDARSVSAVGSCNRAHTVTTCARRQDHILPWL